MIVVKLMGGLGNQMFQYAAGRALAHANKDVLKLDLSHYSNPPPGCVPRKYELYNFKITPDFATDEDLRRFGHRGSPKWLLTRAKQLLGRVQPCYLTDRDIRYNPRFKKATGDVYLDGYWQSTRYFEEIEGTIRSELQPVGSGAGHVMKLWEEIQGCNSVCVNIRRGDFVTDNFLGCLGMDYFRRGQEVMARSVPDVRYFVFSDDIPWCEEHFGKDPATTVVSHDYAGPDFIDYLFLMTSCKHFIIPNSSFAWWAAWLCANTAKRVIAPLRWFNDTTVDTSDIVPATWQRV